MLRGRFAFRFMKRELVYHCISAEPVRNEFAEMEDVRERTD